MTIAVQDRHRSRRITFGSVATTVMLAIFATLLGPMGVLQSASAATGANVTWRISSEPGDARSGYAGMLNGIRSLVRAAQSRPDSNGPAVDVTDPTQTSSYITIDLHAEDRPEFIRVFMRRSDQYVMGWRQGVEDGAGDVSWGSFFPLEAAAAPGGASALPGANANNTNSRFVGLASYTDLAQQGATRDGLQITPASLNNAVLTLQGGDQATTRSAAQSILQVIQAVAEGSRFRNQAADTATAFGNGQPLTINAQFMAQQNNWAVMSRALLTAALGIGVILATPLDIGAGVIFVTAWALQRVLMTAYQPPDTKGRGTLETSSTTMYVQPDPFGDYPTIQDAVNAAPSDGVQRTLLLAKGTYHEAVVVPATKRNLFIKGEQGTAADQVVITADRAHGMTNPATGQPYGTEGSAVLTVKAPGVTVGGITIQNTFDPANHPEVGPFDTQAVAVAAEGDRQTFTQDRIISRQDTILAKSPVPTDQNRQYFVGSYIEGSIDFIFGNATAVIDRCNLAMDNWVGGTVLAPNTDQSKKYGILISGSHIYTNGVPAGTMYLGRPWHNTPTVSPQAVVRDTVVDSGITAAHPWTDMVPDYSWTQARFKEYHNSGVGAGVGANAPQMSDSEAGDYTAEKYLAGTDGWDPVF